MTKHYRTSETFKRFARLALLGSTVMTLQLPSSACAQTAPAAVPSATTSDDDKSLNGDIVVTAQNRLQSLRDVPISITAVGAAEITANHVRDFSDIANLAPAFVSGTNYGYIRNSSMRGISNNSYGFADDPSIAMFVDGVYQGRGSTGMQVNAIYDVARVEIIKGPQATLFGRSSIAGAISIINNQPTDSFEGALDLGVGSRNRILVRGVVNLPVNDDLAVRVAFNSEDQKGYIRNLNGGADLQPLHDHAGRFIARYIGIPGLTATLQAGYEQRRQSGSIPVSVGLPDFTANITPRGDENFARFDIFQTGLNLAFDLGGGFTLTSDTSYRSVRNAYVEDYDAVPQVIGGPYEQRSTDRLFQQEFKVGYSIGKTSVTAGASVFSEKLNTFIGNWVDSGLAFTGSPNPGLLPNSYALAFYEDGTSRGKFHGWSVFGDASVPLSSRLILTGGVRYNYDSKFYSETVPNPSVLPQNAGKPFAGAYYNWGYYTTKPIFQQKNWNNVSFRAAANYDIGNRNILYVQYSQGWKSGGIDSFKVSVPAGSAFRQYFGMDASAFGVTPNIYNPEFSNNYEIGIKGASLDKIIRYELSAYHYTYRDLQVAVFENSQTTIRNIGRARGDGVELNLNANPTRSLSLFANGAYTFTKILSFAADPRQVGLPLNQAPRFTSAAGATYTWFGGLGLPGNLSFGGNVTQRSKFRTDNTLTESVKGYELFNLRGGYAAPDERYTLSIFVDNVADTFTYGRYNPITPFGFPVARVSVIGLPRTIGVDLRFRF